MKEFKNLEVAGAADAKQQIIELIKSATDEQVLELLKVLTEENSVPRCFGCNDDSTVEKSSEKNAG